MTATHPHIRIARVVLSALVLVGLFGAVGAHAQALPYRVESLPSKDVFSDFVVGPGKVDITLNPGESKTIDVMLSNRMGDERNFDIIVEDMKGSDDPEQTVVLLGADRGPYSLRDFVSTPISTIRLAHADRAVIPVTITMPADAQPGGYYGSVLFATASKPKEANVGGTAIISRIGVLFFVTVPGAQAFEGKLEGFNTNGTLFWSGPVSFQMLFRNTGNIHLSPTGEITIKNMIGTQVESLEIEPWFSLPHSLRLREVVWDRPALAGRYTATAQIKRGYGGHIDTMTLTFWVVPWKQILVIIAGVFFLFFVIRFFATRFEFKRKT